MFARCAACTQPVDEVLGQALDDLRSLVSQESEYRQADRKVAAQKTAALDEHYFGAFLQSSRLGCHKSRRACAHDQDIPLRTHRNPPGRFFNLFHFRYRLMFYLEFILHFSRHGIARASAALLIRLSENVG